MNSVTDSTAIEPSPETDDETADTGAIAWLLPEIVAAFDAATLALRAFRAGAAGVARADVDLAPLRIARSHVHQAHGALEMGEFLGVTRLTEAVEDLLASFEGDPARCDATALDAIIGSCRSIVEYLEDVQRGEPQQPLRLFPSYRDLLVARRLDRIHPADLFAVDLQVRVPRDDHAHDAPVLGADGLREQRHTFEQGLLRHLRHEDDAAASAMLVRAVSAIDASVAAHPVQGQGRHRAYWWATRAFFEALQEAGFAHVPTHRAHIKRLAGRVNLQIGRLIDGSSVVADRLFTDTLFFVALAAPVTPHVRAVKARFRLDCTIPDDYEVQRYGRIDAGVLSAAREALASAKSAWSAIVAGDVGRIPGFARDTGAVVEAVGPIRRRGLAQVAQVIDGIATDLGFDPRQPAPNVGLDVATALLFLESSLERARSLDEAFDARASLVVARVEAAVLGHDGPATSDNWLDRMSREAEERLTLGTFVAELQASLQNAEKILDAFFRDPSNRAALPEARRLLAQASGALSLLGHDEVHAAIDHARATIERFEQAPDAGDTAAFEPLAQSLGAVGFYVGQIERERIDRDAFHFDAATGRFSADMARAPAAVADAWAEGPAAELPWRVEADAAPSPAVHATPASADRSDDLAFAATDVLFAATEVLSGATIEEEIAMRAADAQDRIARLREHPDDATARAQLEAAVDDVRRNAMLIDDRELQDEAASLLRALRDGQHEPLGFASAAELADRVTELAIHANRAAGIVAPSFAPLEPSMPVPSADNVDAIDAELLEIFLEEAHGVLADAEASLRVLDADPESATATANLRRGFHTLKGSGRMVGLMSFGDAAWSIEDTLNGHIADQRPASTDLRALIDYAIRYLADWVGELRDTGHSSRIPDALVEAAKAVRHRADANVPTGAPLDDATDVAAHDAPAPATTPRARDDDTQFAATQVIGDDVEVPELIFFGLQPHAPTDAPPLQSADEIASPAAAFGPMLDFDVAAEAPDFSGFLFDDPAPEPVEASAADATEAPGASPDRSFDDEVARAETSGAPALDPADDLSLGFETDTVVSAGLDDERAAIGAEAGQTAIVLPDEPVAVDVPGDAITSDPLDETLATGSEAAAAPYADNVSPFPFAGPFVPAGDDVRQIGSLTLSVALFNIYLTEADELLRVLTQDFAEWRHELDRYVSEGAMRAVHSLAGSSATVGCVAAHDLAAGIEVVLQALWREPVVLREDQVERLQDSVESLRKMLHRFAAERLPEPDAVRLAGLLAMKRELAGDESVGGPSHEAATATVGPIEAAHTAPPFEPLDFGDAPSTAESTGDAVVDEALSADDGSMAAGETVDAGTAGRLDFAGTVDDETLDERGAGVVVEQSLGAASIAGFEAPVDGGASTEAEAPGGLDLSFDSGSVVETGDAADAGATSTIDVAVDAEATADVEAIDALAPVEAAAPGDSQAVATNEAVATTEVESASAFEAVLDEARVHASDVAAGDAGPRAHDALVAGTPPPDDAVEVARTADAAESAAIDVDPAIASTSEPQAVESVPPIDDRVVPAPAEADEESPVAMVTADPFASSAALDASRPYDDADFASEPATSHDDALREAIAAGVRSAPAEARDGALPLRDEIDPDLLEVFVAEGGEILPQIGTLLRSWQARPDDAAPARQLLRHLHTLKGSARMAGAMQLGEVVHDLETRVESAARLHRVPPNLVDELLASHDRSLELFDRLQSTPAESGDGTTAAPTSTADAVGDERVHAEAPVEPLAAVQRAAPDPRANDAASKPAVRVDSETLDRLVNLAGEVSISRARIENEVQLIKTSMSDLNDNVERLRAQLREIEMQAEFQMQSQMQSQQASGEEREKFDPLEFDRFTRFQELTRMMAESVNDVKTLQSNLVKSLDAAEGDLASQRRMTRDLQQDLMRVRMVPFGSIAERLYRVARRTAKEVDKRVNLDIRGGAVEIDRSVLERMAGPFEHLLRNHIVHGIESREARHAAGKDEIGELLVEVRQEGNEIVMTFSDDGAGLDHDRIRAKGRALGLIGDGVSDAEAAELIFHPGFSTATEVTELAGRGVGMDVVRAEAMVLAGRVAVDTTAGRGTRFTINLPLTLAITQVVLVGVAGRVHALPAVLVEQVQQLRPQALADAYRAGHLPWADASVRLVFLGALLGLDDVVPVAQRTSPVLILRSAGERIAIHVDEVIGNQEVVVKNLGPQLARMTGIAGATVLGSGQIVLILNPVQLAQMTRADAVRAPSLAVAGDGDAVASSGDLKTLPTVMVVDDSLTVRRVTQRLLSREGYQVVLAKDGVDALEQLQGFPPDVMLVDIEMPRMDGFDLTRNVRNDDRYKHIPIIMITSRTAEKHRLHAAELGVDAYLGKPYGEDELLELLAMHTRTAGIHPA